MPPETPASTNLMPCSFASPYRRCESRKFEFPPSTITSPGDASPSSVWNVSSVIFPAGTIIQNERGASSWSRSSSSVSAVESTPGSNVFMSWPRSSRRFVMFPPIRPRPIIPSCIRYASLPRPRPARPASRGRSRRSHARPTLAGATIA